MSTERNDANHRFSTKRDHPFLMFIDQRKDRSLATIKDWLDRSTTNLRTVEERQDFQDEKQADAQHGADDDHAANGDDGPRHPVDDLNAAVGI